MDSSLIGTNKKLNISGDYDTAVKYVPFARRKLTQLIDDTKRLGIFFDRRFFNLLDAKITIEVRFNIGIISIEGIKETKEKTVNYVNGLTRKNDIINEALREFYGREDTTFSDLLEHDIPPNSFVSDLGYDVGTKTQHSFIKPSKYSGLMKYAIQNLLGQNKEIGYNFGFNGTDGLLLESVKYSVEQEEINGSTLYYQKQQEVQLRNIKISSDGVFIRKALNTLIPDVTLNYNNPGLGCRQDLTNIDFLDETIHQDLRYFNQLLTKTDFIIPAELSDYVYDDETTYQLLNSTDMQQFYSKNPFFNSCGWLFSNTPTNYIEETTSRGKEFEYTVNAYNTCYDIAFTYLYGIQIKCRKIVFSDTFKQSSTYLTDPKYKEQKDYIYEYSASIHELLEGMNSNLSSSGLSWLEGNSGLYFPDEVENKCKNFSFGELVINESGFIDFAPVYVVKSSVSDYSSETANISDISVNGINLLEKFPNIVEVNEHLTCVGVMDIKNVSRRYDINGTPTVVNGIDNESMKSFINNNFKHIITNNAIVNFYTISDNSEFNIYTSDTNVGTVDQSVKILYKNVNNYADTFGKYILKDTYEVLNGTQTEYTTTLKLDIHNKENGFGYGEKVVVPMDNRNSIICYYTGLAFTDIIDTEDNFNDDRYRFPLTECIISTNGYIFPETYSNTNLYLESSYFGLYNTLIDDFVGEFKPFERIYIYPTQFTQDALNIISGSGYIQEMNSLIYGELISYPSDYYTGFSVKDNLRSKFYFSEYIESLFRLNTEYINVRLVLNVKNNMFCYYVDDTINAIVNFDRLSFNKTETSTNNCLIEEDVYSPITDYVDLNFIGNP